MSSFAGFLANDDYTVIRYPLGFRHRSVDEYNATVNPNLTKNRQPICPFSILVSFAWTIGPAMGLVVLGCPGCPETMLRKVQVA